MLLLFNGKEYVSNTTNDLELVCLQILEDTSLEEFLENTRLYGVNAKVWTTITLNLMNNPFPNSTNRKGKAVYGKNKGRSSYWVLFTHPFILDKDGSPKRFKRGVGSSLTKVELIITGLNKLLEDPKLWKVPNIYSLLPDITEDALELFFDQNFVQGTTYPFSCLHK